MIYLIKIICCSISVEVIEEVVFQPSTAPLLLAVQPPLHRPMLDALPGDMGDVTDDFLDEAQIEKLL